MKLLFTGMALILTSSLSFAAEKPEGLGSSSLVLLERNIEVEEGYGEGHYYKAETSETDSLVNQGFAMLNLFQYTDAFRSFETALDQDPNLKIANVGRAFAARSLDARSEYYPEIALEALKSDLVNLDESTKAWGDLLSSLVAGTSVDGQPLTPAAAYTNFKSTELESADIQTYANWVSNSYIITDFEEVLESDPNNAGALHYLLHMSEGQNDHQSALDYGARLIKIATSSGHAQHMYGHVLPHFNRWNEADKQFTIADGLHKAWGQKNNVSPSEDWHYYHNLDLWSVSKMVVDAGGALEVLGKIQELNTYALLDYLDYASATFPVDAKGQIEGVLNQVEGQSPDLKNLVLSSRLYFELVFNPGQESFDKVVTALNSGANFKNQRLLYMFLTLLQARNSDQDQFLEIQENIINDLRTNFERGGFDGWKKSVIEALMYKRMFQLYGLEESVNALEENVFDAFMNPVD
jgi:Tfp pilus assembly protein PilF